MGLPQQEQPPSQPSTSTSTSTSTDHKDLNPSATQLPPEAITLATKLFDLARQGSTAPLHQYITAGIPVNLTNHKGDTLLMLAAYHGNLSTVTMLLEAGADTNVLNERGQSPIAGAVFKGYFEVVEALWKGGADVGAGQPNAVDAARMFRRGDMLGLFGIEEGEGGS
ncbi:hypothetical protein B0A50_03497 [Salinomyces thailandicus]|uniref:Uncharacterized protein n=1 Tax=Salinomyces thailandicus TaxID=706561 RepID=A0A4U0U3U9_9PEZI|nr:hypothetical protein B0A50_03497 [Salinomyces thailandica]